MTSLTNLVVLGGSIIHLRFHHLQGGRLLDFDCWTSTATTSTTTTSTTTTSTAGLRLQQPRLHQPRHQDAVKLKAKRSVKPWAAGERMLRAYLSSAITLGVVLCIYSILCAL
ncbi:hypothetical protein BC832DRAFT_148245 [Gaertneriomyces semiglobifer]|nr:hypothetical protein BC832DRAFT_148245 [Gaertneriomyces semiglobifer]